MVSSLKYKNSSAFAINLSGDSGLYGQTALKIRGYAWDYSTGDHALAGVSRSAREADLEIIAYREEGRRLNSPPWIWISKSLASCLLMTGRQTVISLK